MLCAGGLAACVPAGTPVPVATQTLIPATATLTPLPVTPTPPPATLPEPGDIVVTPTTTPIVPLMKSEIVLPDAFIRTMLLDLAAFLGSDVDSIRFARVERGVWLNEDLGCSLENLFTLPLQPATGYSVTLVAGTTAYRYHTVATERFRRCEQTAVIQGELLMAVDPVALEMAGLAQRQVAHTLDLPVRRIRLVDIALYIWPDTSLGCPVEGSTYESASIPGYRIIVAAGESEYLFHTDADRLYLCEPEYEVLE